MTPLRYTRALPLLVLPMLLLSAGCTTVSRAPNSPVLGPPVAAAPSVPTDPLPDAVPSPALATIAGGPESAIPSATPVDTAQKPRPVAKPRRARRVPPAEAPTRSRRNNAPKNACDGLAAGGLIPTGGTWHRWCRVQEHRR